MSVDVKVSGATRQAAQEAATPEPKAPEAPRAPSMKRPDGLSDTEWAIMKTAKNEDVHKRVNAIMSGDAEPSAEEAAILLEIVAAAEMAALKSYVNVRKSIAPKLAAAQDTANALSDIKVRLFRHATRV